MKVLRFSRSCSHSFSLSFFLSSFSLHPRLSGFIRGQKIIVYHASLAIAVILSLSFFLLSLFIRVYPSSSVAKKRSPFIRG